MRRFFPIYILLILAMTVGCAKRGSITGGLKDTIPPTMRFSIPENFTTNFKGNTIRITFDEYIKLKDINKQLIVSPPMERAPQITPQTASKYLAVKFIDTLQPNTTYSLNFGQSIEDNNEGNKYPQFKYVFSTGSYIDSLKIAGAVKDAYSNKVEGYVSVMLYEVNETYTDSVIYQKSPRYITSTLDSTTTFQLENLKSGKYLLAAIKDYNNNNRYDPKTDKIAFQNQFITVPTDTLFELELFKEILPFKALKPSQASGNRLLMGFEGIPDSITSVLRNGAEIVPSRVTRLEGKDSVQIWFKPVKADSLQFDVSRKDYQTGFSIKIRSQKNDTLTFKPVQGGTLPLRDDFAITASRPIVSINNSLITVQRRDSAAVDFEVQNDEFNQRITIGFKKEPSEKYTIKLTPGALTDFFDQVNDSLQYSVGTKDLADYANMIVTLQNVRSFPIMVELVNNKGDVLASAYSEKETVINFDAIDPATYTLRVIYDTNGNRQWDTGNFLERRQTEQVIYYPTPIEVRANWDFDQTFTLP